MKPYLMILAFLAGCATNTAQWDHPQPKTAVELKQAEADCLDYAYMHNVTYTFKPIFEKCMQTRYGYVKREKP